MLNCLVTEDQNHKSGWSITLEMLEVFFSLDMLEASMQKDMVLTFFGVISRVQLFSKQNV